MAIVAANLGCGLFLVDRSVLLGGSFSDTSNVTETCLVSEIADVGVHGGKLVVTLVLFGFVLIFTVDENSRG